MVTNHPALRIPSSARMSPQSLVLLPHSRRNRSSSDDEITQLLESLHVTKSSLRVCSSHLIVVAVALQDGPVQRPIQVAHSRAMPLAARDVCVRVSGIVQVDHQIVAGSRKFRPVGGVLEIIDAVGAVLPCE
jgi:hypothetical protein